ncbi:MAG TPA: sulfate reduction electron transfer complex DsrMKJOP subunit DsrJ [Bryobacteraceae bacterium]|nr:sulfate reduction electron transfer complex DsrMKJOP subunit DsrJ [Bryobacteraceae bacterium]
MRDRPVIYCGLLLFAGFLTLPIWHNLAAHVTTKGPAPVLPAHEKQCVAPLAYMRTSHMDLLFDWRADVVRQSGRDYTTFDGRHYNMSLTKTCLQCHGSKAEFCDRCHNYTAVSLPCWNCHLDVKPVLRSAR